MNRDKQHEETGTPSAENLLRAHNGMLVAIMLKPSEVSLNLLEGKLKRTNDPGWWAVAVSITEGQKPTDMAFREKDVRLVGKLDHPLIKVAPQGAPGMFGPGMGGPPGSSGPGGLIQ